MFAVLAAQFLLKPFAAAYFGSGNSAAEYSASTYALFSQALSGLLLIAAGLVLLLTVLQELVQESRHDAHSDALTGLANRRALAGVFEVVRKRAAKSGIPASIAIVDIDHFKNFNDRWGHDTGDAVLRAVARCLESACPPNAVVARLGGEEFVVLMPGMPQQVARLACEKIRIAVSQLNAGPSAVTVSLGSEVAELPKALRPQTLPCITRKRTGGTAHRSSNRRSSKMELRHRSARTADRYVALRTMPRIAPSVGLLSPRVDGYALGSHRLAVSTVLFTVLGLS